MGLLEKWLWGLYRKFFVVVALVLLGLVEVTLSVSQPSYDQWVWK